jgi:CRP/FNR family transcriptional regulator
LKTSAAYKKGETVFREAETCHSVFVVCEGSMKLLTASREGKVLLLGFARPGQVLGLAEAVRDRAPYEFSAIAAEPAIVAIIPRERFVKFAAAYPEASLRLVRSLSEQYKMAQQETKFLAFGETSTARFAHLLLDWSAQRGETAADGIHVASHVTHAELAQSIGSTRETITRILGDLDHRGIIERRAEEIVIRSADELTRLAAY